MEKMAESAYLPYLLVITFLGLLMFYLLIARNDRIQNRFYVKKPPQLLFAVSIIGLSVIFFIAGWQNLVLSEIFYEGYTIHEKFIPDYKVYYNEYNPNVSWMENYRVVKTINEDPLIIGEPLGFMVDVKTNELPQDLVVYIFHEEMMDYLVGSSEKSHGNFTSQIGRIPHFNNYHSTFSLVFPLDEQPSCNQENECHYDLNAKNLKVVFTKSGKYYAYFAVKTNEGIFDYHVSKVSLFTVEDPSELWLRETTDSVASEVAKQRSSNYVSWSFAYMGIGLSLILAVRAYVFSSFGKKQSE